MLTASRPARIANLARNSLAESGRERRWRPARDSVWALLDRHVLEGASVAVGGAGNAHDLPLTRLLARAGSVELLDLSRGPSRRALRRETPALRSRGRAVRCDVTAGVADRVVAAALHGRRATRTRLPPTALGTYDIVIGDLFYSQLLYPALLDARLGRDRVDEALARHGQPLCDAVVARLHASAPVVAHVHDILGWWPGHRPVSSDERPSGCDIDQACAARSHSDGANALALAIRGRRRLSRRGDRSHRDGESGKRRNDADNLPVARRVEPPIQAEAACRVIAVLDRRRLELGRRGAPRATTAKCDQDRGHSGAQRESEHDSADAQEHAGAQAADRAGQSRAAKAGEQHQRSHPEHRAGGRSGRVGLVGLSRQAHRTRCLLQSVQAGPPQLAP
jgi:hypothetical protein